MNDKDRKEVSDLAQDILDLFNIAQYDPDITVVATIHALVQLFAHLKIAGVSNTDMITIKNDTLSTLEEGFCILLNTDISELKNEDN